MSVRPPGLLREGWGEVRDLQRYPEKYCRWSNLHPGVDILLFWGYLAALSVAFGRPFRGAFFNFLPSGQGNIEVSSI